MLGKYSTTSNTRTATTHIYAMRTYFSPRQTSTANVTKPFLRKPAHPVRLNIGTLQNLPSCFHTSRFKSITSIHCQLPLQEHVNNHIDNVNGVTFVTRKHMSPQGPIFVWSKQVVRFDSILCCTFCARIFGIRFQGFRYYQQVAWLVEQGYPGGLPYTNWTHHVVSFFQKDQKKVQISNMSIAKMIDNELKGLSQHLRGN